jgi:hypothetical protein
MSFALAVAAAASAATIATDAESREALSFVAVLIVFVPGFPACRLLKAPPCAVRGRKTRVQEPERASRLHRTTFSDLRPHLGFLSGSWSILDAPRLLVAVDRCFRRLCWEARSSWSELIPGCTLEQDQDASYSVVSRKWWKFEEVA